MVNHIPMGLSRKQKSLLFSFSITCLKVYWTSGACMKNQKSLEAALAFIAEICTNSDFPRKCDLTPFCGAGEGSIRGEYHLRDFSPPFVAHLFQFQRSIKTGVHCRDAEMLCSENQILNSCFQQQNHRVNRSTVPGILVEKLHVQRAAILLQRSL